MKECMNERMKRKKDEIEWRKRIQIAVVPQIFDLMVKNSW
jgi:hypothetical protein